MTALTTDLVIERLFALLDPGSGQLAYEPDEHAALYATGTVDCSPVVVFATDPTIKGGAMGEVGCRRIVEAIELAVLRRCPVIGIWHSGGARLAEGIAALDAVGRIFAAIVAASGRVPQISIILGPAAGGAAYGPALTDFVVMAESGRMFVTGPDVIRSVTGESADLETLGGPAVHGRRSGVAHLTTGTEEDTFRTARALVRLLTNDKPIDPARASEPCSVGRHLPANPRRAYDVRPLIRELLDDAETYLELQADWSRNVVTAFGQLAGATIGVLANNPLRLGGCLDAAAADKAARFVRTCDAFGVPMVVLVDVPGYLPGLTQEWDGVLRRGAKLLYAFAECSVARVTLITRKAYGGAYIAMNGRCLGADAVLCWPDAQCAVMGAEAAVGVLHRRELAAISDPVEQAALRERLTADHQRNAGGVLRARELGAIDAVVAPEDSRRELASALLLAGRGRGEHGNIPL